MLERFRIDGQVAVITGAGKGIGAATAVAFAEAGADVAITARTVDDLERVAKEVEAHGQRALVVPGDVNDLEFLAGLVDRTVAELGGIDLVVNNAGGTLAKPFLDTTVDDLAKSLHFNLLSPFELCRLAVPHMLDRGAGVILNVGSVAGRNATRGSMAHSLTKSALAQLTRLMAAELSPRIRVNAVQPGAIETESLRWWLTKMPDDLRETMLRTIPLHRTGTPEDIAAAILYLCSPASAYVTGRLLDVDGGTQGEVFPNRQPDL